MESFVYLIPAFPLLGFLVLITLGKRLGDPRAGWVGFAAITASFLATVVTWLGMLTHGQPQQQITKSLWEWMHVGTLKVDVAFLIDPLSMTMALFVSGVSALIHLYSIGYMKGDPRFHQFFMYMNLFVFSMLVLVLADNFVLLFLGWEGVGACSYFLIGFWFERNSAATAAKKAFIVNRVGDAGLLIGMFLIFSTIGTLTFYGENHNGVFANLGFASAGTVTAIGLLLLVGAVGKSAQLPLHVWLPDAMEGPTPVSALIHAATMVTAGVYLMVRCAPILEISSETALAVAIVGVASALFAATVACAQNDIKRVLAYSTMSQLGYMFAAVGAGAYAAGMFHMITHAFFKALLFMASGAVIHGLHEQQNIKFMGNMRKYLPVTHGVFVVGWLAICGLFPFSGFWSKDEILASLWDYNKALWAIAAFTVVLTAYYMTRLFVLTFWGKDRWKEHVPAGFHPHEAPRIMLFPMVLLAIAAAFGGALNWTLPVFKDVLGHFLEPVFEHFVGPAVHMETDEKLLLAGVSSILALTGILIAFLIARAARPWPGKLEPRVLGNAWFVDSLYEWTIAKPGRVLATWSAFVFDNRVVDGVVNGTARLVGTSGVGLRRIQTGYVRNYALGVAGGTAMLLIWGLVRSVG